MPSSLPSPGSLWLAGLVLFRRARASAFVGRIMETFATRILLMATSAVASVLIARILGPEGRGQFALAGALAGLGVQFGNLGLHASNTYAVAKDRRLFPMLVANSLFVSFVLGGIGASVAGIVFLAWPSLAPVQGLLLALALSRIPFGLAYLLLQNLLIGIQEVRAYNTIELVSSLLSVVLLVPLIALRVVTPETVFASGVVALVVGLLWLMRRLRPLSGAPEGSSLSLLKENLGYGFQLYAIGLFSFVILRADVFIVDHFLGSSAVGVYAISQTAADLVYTFPAVVGSLLFPKLVEDGTLRARRTTQYAAVAFGSVVGALLLAVPLLEPAIRLLYGRPFAGAAGPGLVLIAAMALYAAGNVVGGYIFSIGKRSSFVLVWLVAALVDLALSVALVRGAGLYGPAVARLVVYGAVLLCAVVVARRSP